MSGWSVDGWALPSVVIVIAGRTKAAWNRGMDKGEKQNPGTKEGLRGAGNLAYQREWSALISPSQKAHMIPTTFRAATTETPLRLIGRLLTDLDSAVRQPNAVTCYCCEETNSALEEGTGGRYPQGVDSTSQQPVAQSSTGAPYEVRNPNVEVDPERVDWTPSKFK
ncbi:hypothetical protein BJ170DRAFT_598682 [Xylariales sp. AK1849]|nr:hypothetical protein BJ170DRAFT_598682 [Xylariales sp. AK1849]